MIISFFDNTRDSIPKEEDLSFAELANRLLEYSNIVFPRSGKCDAPCHVPARFSPLRRAKVNVVERYAFTGDVDDGGGVGFETMRSVLDGLGLAYILHSTTKSTLAANRYRVILPYATALNGPDSEAASNSIHQMLGKVFDTKTFDAGRLSIVPLSWRGAPENDEQWVEADAHHAFAYKSGDPVDAESVIAAHPAPRPVPRPEVDLAALMASMTGRRDADLADLQTSPLVTKAMMQDYRSSPEGGRFFRFMCRAAGRGLRLKVPATAEVVLSLGMQMNAITGNKPRPYAAREAERAVRYAASRYVPDEIDQNEKQLRLEIERLRRRKK